jgi:hypothetical protein
MQKVLRIVAVVLGAAIMTGYASSYLLCFRLQVPQSHIELCSGYILMRVGYDEPVTRLGMHVEWNCDARDRRFTLCREYYFGRNHWMLEAPLWPAVVALGTGTVIAWYACRPSLKKGRCRKCGYDLRGLRAARCPECGLPFSPNATMTSGIIGGQEERGVR